MANPFLSDTARSRGLAEQLYDLLMADIEPELMLSSIPSLDAKYAGETPQAHDERMKRYEAGYRKFDKAFAAFMAEADSHARASKREALKQREQTEKSEDEQALQSIESTFNSSAKAPRSGAKTE